MDDPNEEPLVELGQIVRRVLAARSSDRHLVEDLTQETIVRVASTKDRLSPDAQRAYAIVIARNLLASHGRRESVRGRHAHRLVDYTQLDGPEHLLLEREETDALAAALEHLDPDDRALLLRHEAEGVDLATIAADTGTSRGAVAMRLSRARATLRLEFLLAFRNVERPSASCRAVLLALSTGDHRRQEALDAPAHLVTCDSCAALAQPVTERNRRIAGWLLLPVAEGVRRIWHAARSHPAAAAAAVAAVVAVAVGAVVLRAGGDAPPTEAATAPPSTAASNEAGVVAPTRTAPTATSTPVPTTPVPTTLAPPTLAPTVPPPTRLPIGPATVCPAPVPLDQLDAASPVGCAFTSTVLTAIEVPVDEGFWAATATQQLVWVRLVGQGESPVAVEPGQRVAVAGVIAAPPADPNVLGPQPTLATPAPTRHVDIPFDQLALVG
ncbi:MAG: RNA polymerase sigma factor [Ilumatobacteraceae bacterium]